MCRVQIFATRINFNGTQCAHTDRMVNSGHHLGIDSSIYDGSNTLSMNTGAGKKKRLAYWMTQLEVRCMFLCMYMCVYLMWYH